MAKIIQIFGALCGSFPTKLDMLVIGRIITTESFKIYSPLYIGNTNINKLALFTTIYCV